MLEHVVLALTTQQVNIVAAALGKLPLEIAYDTFESVKRQHAQQVADAAKPPEGPKIVPPPGPLRDAPGYEGPAPAAED